MRGAQLLAAAPETFEPLGLGWRCRSGQRGEHFANAPAVGAIAPHRARELLKQPVGKTPRSLSLQQSIAGLHLDGQVSAVSRCSALDAQADVPSTPTSFHDKVTSHSPEPTNTMATRRRKRYYHPLVVDSRPIYHICTTSDEWTG